MSSQDLLARPSSCLTFLPGLVAWPCGLALWPGLCGLTFFLPDLVA